MQETEFKYYSGSSRSCLSPSIKLVSHVESRKVQLIKDLTLALFGESLINLVPQQETRTSYVLGISYWEEATSQVWPMVII